MTTKGVNARRKIVVILLVVLGVAALAVLPLTTNAQSKQEKAHQYMLCIEIIEVSTIGDNLVQCIDTEDEV